MITEIFLGIAAVVFFFSGIRIVEQYKNSVLFTFGRYTRTMRPGFNWIFPIIQTSTKVDMRQRVIDLKAQSVMTSDQVNLTIDGVVFYSVDNARDALINVKDLQFQLAAKATAELKEIMGSRSMRQALADRDNIASDLCKRLTETIQDSRGKNLNWGIVVRDVQINNITLPEQLTRALAKAAEATQEKDARLTKAQGELAAAKMFKDAATTYASNPISMRLRELQTFQEIGAEQNSLMLVIPSDIAIDPKVALSIGASTLYQQSKTHKKK